MRWIDGLSKSQRVVVVIAFGLVLGILGLYLVNLNNPLATGWYAYAPLSRGLVLAHTGLRPWLRLVIWLVLIGAWALGSIGLLRPPSKEAPAPSE